MRTDAGDDRGGGTVIENLAESIGDASKFNPNDVVAPDAVLWTDQDGQWEPIIPELRSLLPQLLTFGNYDPGSRMGPAIWLRSVVDCALPDVELPEGVTPIVYLPGVGRQELRAVEECPARLRPLVELQYRGTCWTQKNGKDWTVESFLVSEHGGLGFDVARDGATRRAQLGALEALAATPIKHLTGRRLAAKDFNRLVSDDPPRDLLSWLNDPEATRGRWTDAHWSVFKARCKDDFGFDPDADGELVAAERLGEGEGPWGAVWRRFGESPALYPGLHELLRRAKPASLLAEASMAWPQTNEQGEDGLRKSMLELGDMSPEEACARVGKLEKEHGRRRASVWAKLGQAPLADALGRLSQLAEAAAVKLGGRSPDEMATRYADGGWKVDAAAVSAANAVRSAADWRAVEAALAAVYRPWLESAAERLQALVMKEPLPGRDGQEAGDMEVEPRGIVLFADGLRFDVAQDLVSRLRARGRATTVSTRWAGLPSVTATAKPAVSPIAGEIAGLSPGEQFTPVVAEEETPLTTDRFRKLLASGGYEHVSAHETGVPSGRGWTESGEIDKRGHSLGGKLAADLPAQVDLLCDRVEDLLVAGWNEVRVVTDHGWLWLPGGLPKVDLPKYLTESRWARCAAIKGDSSVEVPTVRWHWNEDERVAVAPGIACFRTGHEYAHGGVSLQECLIPVIRVTAREGAGGASADICEVGWAGLRCRVRVETAQSGLSVDLRTKTNDASSSVTQARELDAKGTASLLVEDDDREGQAAMVVVLDAAGNVMAKRATAIGGEA